MDISVIIPIYNGEKYISSTLDSVLVAINKVIGEIILIDDGSTDSSPDICKEYSNKYTNIVYERKDNEGIVSARNRGIERSNADYICFCDQDDYVDEDMYVNLLTKIKSTSADMGFCGAGKIVDGEKRNNESFIDKVYTVDEIANEILNPILFYGTTFGRPMSERWVGTVWKGIYERKTIIENSIRFRRYVNYEDDLLFFLDVLTCSETVFSMSYVGYYWRINSESETYNWKYIEDFAFKSEQMWTDVCTMAGRVINDNSVIDAYKAYQICRLYDQQLLNEGSAYNTKPFCKRLKEVKKSVKKYGRDKLKFRARIAPEYKRTKVVLGLLTFRMFGIAYKLNIWYRKNRELKSRLK